MVNKRGFTLVEILVVVAIIGILASIVLVGLGNPRASAQDAKRLSDLRQVQNALELYFNANGTYPVYDTAGDADFDSMAADILAANVGPSQLPDDPRVTGGGTPGYGYASDGVNYLLGAQLDTQPPAGYQPPVRPFPSGWDAVDVAFVCDGAPPANAGDFNYCIAF